MNRVHTIFVNTAERIKTSHHEKLFECLMLKSELQILNYDIEHLSECAEHISEMITRFQNIDESYNIIVYTETKNRNEVALADERVAALVIEEELFARLYELGRKPEQALIIFGENFTRNAEYGLSDANKRIVKTALWNAFPIPNADKVREIITEIRSRFAVIADSDLTEYKQLIWSRLTEIHHNNSLLRIDSKVVRATVYEMAESVKNDSDTADLLNELFMALTNQKYYVRKNVTGEKVRYAHLRITDSDINAQSRSEFRLLLYVYYCAVEKKIDLLYLPKNSGNEQGLALGAESVPEVNWDLVATMLKKDRKIYSCEKMFLTRDDVRFPSFNENLINEKNLVKLSCDVPELDVHAKAHHGFTVKQLKDAADRTLSEIAEKSRGNDKVINNYITSVTDSFNADKDSAMNGCEYKKEGEFINNDDLAAGFIKEELDKVNAKIAKHPKISPAAAHIESVIKSANDRLDYLFECLNKNSIALITGVVFALIFVIPHIITQREISGVLYGAVFYAASVAAVMAAYILGCLWFRNIYKKRIVKELDGLCERYCETQRERQLLMENYSELLSREIPLSFCLKKYSDELSEYLERKNSVFEHKTYHTRELSQYSDYVSNLLNDLEISGMGEDKDLLEDYSGKLDIEEGKYQNSAVYSVIDKADVQACFTEPADGGDR